jgi:hypothetical protein
MEYNTFIFTKYLYKFNSKTKNLQYFFVFIIILYPIFFIFQEGADLTDVGFLAMYYQNFFDYLNVGKPISTETILSTVIGAGWLKVFPYLGVLGLQFCNLFFIYFTLWIIYKSLIKVTQNRLIVLFGILCGLTFGIRWLLFLTYDYISYFFLILTSYFLIKGLNSKKNIFFFYSGLLIILAALSKLPNIVLIFITPLILIYNNLYKNHTYFSKYLLLSLNQYIYFILGTIIAVSGVFFLFLYLDFYDFYLDNLHTFKNSLVKGNTSQHSMSYLLEKYKKDSINFLPHLFVVTSLTIITSLVYKYSKIKKTILPILIFGFLLFVAAFLNYRDFTYQSKIKYFVPAFCTLPIILSIIRKDKFSNLVVVFSTITLVQVIGTNTGLFLKFSWGFMALIPLSIIILSEKNLITFKRIKIFTKPIWIIGASIILLLSIYARIGWIYHVESGVSSRLKCIYPIEHPKMKGIFTKKENAKYIEELSNSIEINMNDENNLFIYGHQPMFYYLTESTPPVRKFWLTNQVVQVEELFTSLEKSIEKTGSFPLIVDTKETIMGDKGQKRLEKFLKDFDYKLKESNENFDIWISHLK